MALNYQPGPLTTIEVTWHGNPDTPAGSVVVRGPHGVSDDGKPVTPGYLPVEEFEVELDKDAKPVLPVEVGILDEIRRSQRVNSSREVEVYHVAVIAVTCRISRDQVIGLTPENEAKVMALVTGKRGPKIEFVGHYAGFENPVTWLKAPAPEQKPEPKPLQVQATRPRPAARPANQPANQTASPAASGSAANANAGNGPAS